MIPRRGFESATPDPFPLGGPPVVNLHDPDPSDPEVRRRGTVIGSPAQGFDGDAGPLVDAGSWALARSRWSIEDLARAPLEALVLSAPLSPIDRRVVGRAFYERAKLAGALLELRAAAEDLSVWATGVGALLRSAMWADPQARAQAVIDGRGLVESLATFRSAWERHCGPGDMLHPWPGLRRTGRVDRSSP